MSDIVERLCSDAASSQEGYQCICYVRTLTEAAGTITDLRAEVVILRHALGGIFAYFDGKRECQQAPGHCHDVPGIWDIDNDPSIAGKSCDWCAHWNAARAALTQTKDTTDDA